MVRVVMANADSNFKMAISMFYRHLYTEIPVGDAWRIEPSWRIDCRVSSTKAEIYEVAGKPRKDDADPQHFSGLYCTRVRSFLRQ